MDHCAQTTLTPACTHIQIASVKSKIKDTQGHAVELQKIIYSGKILTDAQTVEECKIKEKDFLVVMVSKVSAHIPASQPAASR